MSSVAVESRVPTAQDSVAAAPPVASPSVKRWLVGPAFDLLFVANLLWPLAMLISLSGNAQIFGPLSLFQIYFLSSPHRWITLVMVFGDSERFWKEPRRFGLIGLGLVSLGLALVGAALLWDGATNSLVLLMMLDYGWNAWHFAAQHAGIAAIYRRMGRIEKTERAVAFEMSAIRLLVLWVFLRLALAVGKTKLSSTVLVTATTVADWIDPLMLLPALALLAMEIRDLTTARLGRLCYVGSVIGLYAGQLAAIRFEHQPLMTAFFFAGAIFHATEYLAVVNWSVQSRTTGIWKYHAARGGVALLTFAVVIGIGNLAIHQQSAYAWALITLLVSLLHYGYDGMIWKSKKKPRTA